MTVTVRFLVRFLAALILAAALVSPGAVGHGAPPKRDQDTRLMHDYNDDCGGDDGSALAKCGGSHDVIALDVREAYDGTRGDLVIFRLFLNGAPAAGLHDEVSFQAGGASKSFALSTNDNVHFTATGADSVSDGMPLGDGTRFVVETTLRRAELGDVGTALMAYRVEAYKGEQLGDFMPGTYRTAAGTDGPVPASEGSQPTKGEVAKYTLRGPAYLIALTHAGDGQVPPGGEASVALTITNPLRTTPQTVTLTVSATNGATALIHGAGPQPTTTATLDLAKASSGTVHILISGEAAGTATVVATTSLGGRAEHAVPFTVGDASPASPNGGGSKGSPGIPAILTFTALAAFAGLRRRT